MSALRHLIICAGVLLALDSAVLARKMSLLHLPGEMNTVAMLRRGGYGVASQLRSSAERAGLEEVPYVKEALERLEAAMGLAASPADVAKALRVEARDVDEALRFARAGYASWSRLEQERQREEEIRRLQEEVRRLREELARLKETAGSAELIGPGVIVRAYDAEDGYRSREIVHERDIKEILSALFSAGAKGAEVGGQRITAQSSVRCAGPVILVNQRPIPVNPVVIKAVGDPKALGHSLAEIRARFSRDRKRLEVEEGTTVTLAAYVRR